MKTISVIILAGVLTACSQFVPFEDTRREAGRVQPVGQSTNTRPVICYNPLWHDLDQTKPLAEQACARTNKKAIYVETETVSCRLFNPSAAIYKCE